MENIARLSCCQLKLDGTVCLERQLYLSLHTNDPYWFFVHDLFSFIIIYPIETENSLKSWNEILKS